MGSVTPGLDYFRAITEGEWEAIAARNQFIARKSNG